MNLNIDVKIICFADDTIIFIQEEIMSGLYNKANLVFKKIKLWFDNNFLELNLDKTIIFNVQKEIIKHNFKLIDHSEICVTEKFVNCTCKIIDKVDNIKYLS